MKRTTAFTLVELLVAIAIIGVISSIAYPSYQSYMLDTRRAEAKTELIKAQLKQTSLHILNPSYSNSEIELGFANSEYYTFTVISAGTTTYSLQAVAKGSQLNDSGCTTLTTDQDSNFTPSSCW
ncbi:type IV minor pilin protein PilE [Psychromonas marina]|uniref:Type IV minor pilin protein PilE n=1 Tax=Psychromonas marina TaxID=88364 RepID=A0ABQ6E4R0_9GAMM|nr:type IV pilin protein [Psychromonas marina]GLS92316.1 type IV minor pilin protein PilE [Psychromonas marina]